MIKVALIKFEEEWKNFWNENVAGLSLLGRTLLSLADAGIEMVVFLGANPSLTQKALDGRSCQMVFLHFSENASVTELQETLLINPEELCLVFSKPFALNTAIAKKLVSYETPFASFGISISTLFLLPVENNDISENFPEDLFEKNSVLLRPITLPEQLIEAENALIDTTRKPMLHDGAIAFYLMRPISRRLTRLLWNTSVTPNQISILALLLGVSGGVVASFGEYRYHLLGAILFFSGAIIDCIDGELARLKHMGSQTGQWLDTLADDISTAAYLLGLGKGVSLIPFWSLNPWKFSLLCTAIFVLSSLYIYYVLARYIGVIDTTRFPYFFQKSSTNLQETNSGSFVSYAFKRDFFAALFVILAFWGMPWVSLLLLGLGAIGNASAVFITFLKR